MKIQFNLILLLLFAACTATSEEILFFSVSQHPTKKQLAAWNYKPVMGVDAEIYKKNVNQWEVSYSFEKKELLAKQLELKIDTLILTDLVIDSLLQSIHFKRTTPIGIKTHFNGTSSMRFQCQNNEGNDFTAFSQLDDTGNWLTLTHYFSRVK
ncbi:MAG TPA: hypothetical protein PKM03_11055 [Cyclobacteriaceae bacterium]|nr:hypothetical protein [Cyclobacteriaceae bacterium]